MYQGPNAIFEVCFLFFFFFFKVGI